MKRDLYALLLLLDLKLSDWLGKLKAFRLSRAWRILAVAVFAAGVAALMYRLSLYVFGYLLGIPELGQLVITRLFELAFLLFFLALILSTALTALALLYRDDELEFLFSLPLPEGVIFSVKYLEIILHSSWALVILTVPFILSYGAFIKLPWLTFLGLFGGMLLPLVLISGSIGVGTAMMLRWLLGGVPRKRLAVIAIGFLAAAVGILSLVIFAGSGPAQRGLAYLFTLLPQGGTPPATLAPHKLIAQGFLSILANKGADVQRIILTLWGLCALLILLVFDMGKVLYFRSYLAATDKSRTGNKPLVTPFESSIANPKSWVSPIYKALLFKDIIQFVRSPRQWSQALLLLGFWAFYIANLVNLNRLFDLSAQFWKMLFFYANFCFSCYFAAAVAGRFIFPQVSQEGRSFWALKSAPLALDSFLWGKFWQAFVPLFFLSGSMVAAGDVLLGVHPGLFEVSMLAIFIVCFSMTALALGLGAVFADFSQTDPARTANSPGGILCIFFSLILTVVVSTVFAWPTYLHYKFTQFTAQFPLSEWITVTILVIALGLAATIIPLKMGLRALQTDLKL